MPHEKADPALLWDMLDAATAINSFVTGRTFHEYLNNRMLRGAVERHLEIIGEAAKGFLKDFSKSSSRNPLAPDHCSTPCLRYAHATYEWKVSNHER